MPGGVERIVSLIAGDSDDVDQSFRSDVDQDGAKRRRALSVWNSDRHQSIAFAFFLGWGEEFRPCRRPVFWALTEGARRATGVSAQKHFAARHLLAILIPPILLLAHRLALEFDLMRRMHQPVQGAVGYRRVADLRVPLRHRQLAGQQR